MNHVFGAITLCVKQQNSNDMMLVQRNSPMNSIFEEHGNRFGKIDLLGD